MGPDIELWYSEDWGEVARAHALKNEFSLSKDFRDKSAEWVEEHGLGYSRCLTTAIFAHDDPFPLEDPYIIKTFNQILKAFCEKNNLHITESADSEFLEIDANRAAKRLGFLWKSAYNDFVPADWLHTIWMPALNDVQTRTTENRINEIFSNKYGFTGISEVKIFENMANALNSLNINYLSKIDKENIQSARNNIHNIINDKENIEKYKLCCNGLH